MIGVAERINDMIWTVCFIISASILAASVLYILAAMRKYKSGRILRPFHVIFAGVFAAVLAGLMPVMANMFEGQAGSIIKICLFDVLQTIQVFTFNAGADLIIDNISSASTNISGIYSTYMTILFFVAPVLTVGFIISLFRNVMAEISYLFHLHGDVYAFSDLNEKSITLAASIRENHKHAIFVFANTGNDADEGSDDIEAAKELGGICFQKEIDVIDLRRFKKDKKIYIFTISSNEMENIEQSLKLAERYKEDENCCLYVFSAGIEGELLLTKALGTKMKIRRVNEVMSLIYRFLYEDGFSVFQKAADQKDGSKKITAVIIGLGRHGTELLKALAWFCQMDGYSIEIHAFDRDPLAKDKISALCPELLSEQYNGVSVPGESQYKINIYPGIDIKTKTYMDIISQIPDITFSLICLGNDKLNISSAVDLRMMCERCGSKPVIKAVVNNPYEKKALAGITNYRGQSYDIDFIGGVERSYAEDVIISNDLEKLALERHLKWGEEDDFWKYEYNYRSSMASAIHMKARISCGIPGADKAETELTDEERDRIEKIEHRRWNAYMRSEGYVYSGSPEKSSRNDLAKMHHNLVVFDQLTEEDKRKDSSVGTV